MFSGPRGMAVSCNQIVASRMFEWILLAVYDWNDCHYISHGDTAHYQDDSFSNQRKNNHLFDQLVNIDWWIWMWMWMWI